MNAVMMAEVDAVIAEAVWAIDALVRQQTQWDGYVPPASLARCHAFLASQLVTDWRARQAQAIRPS